jgi:tRNA uridine 5-carbamoylmethylation protein Kti12
MQEKDDIVIIILSGIPCSGKSTWADLMSYKMCNDKDNSRIVGKISREGIREKLIKTKGNNVTVAEVNSMFYKTLGKAATLKNTTLIVDDLHITEKEIDKYLAIFRSLVESGNGKVYIKFFNVSLWKALWRNFWRKNSIPSKWIIRYYKMYKLLKQDKYKNILFDEF